MTVNVRFAPSPTGYLHIGGARTALFNYLFAKSKGGNFLLRIEDTDKKRSTEDAIKAIISGLSWLGLKQDKDIVLQSKNEERHKQVAYELLAKGMAYKCFATTEELEKMRADAEAKGEKFRYPNIWRDRTDHPEGKPFAIRIKAPLTGEILINDLVQGEVKTPSNELDDMIILRADGTPTYMLAVVVDDVDMNITHVIRGDDHLTNTFRQIVVYNAMEKPVPAFAHIPLIHGPDGAKLSKRHGALGVEAYEEMGFLPEALVNYLMGLGWHYSDEEVMKLDEAVKAFDISKIGRSPSRLDFAKMNHINSLYLRALDEEKTLKLLKPFLEKEYGDKCETENFKNGLKLLLAAFKERSQNFVELAKQTIILVERISPYTEKAANMLEKGKEYLPDIISIIENISDWNAQNIHDKIKGYGEEKNIKAGVYMPAIRAAVCGTMESPSLDLVLFALGKEEVLKRLKNI